MLLGVLSRLDRVRWVEPFALFSLSAVAAVVGGRAWSLLAWWLDPSSPVQWEWNPLAPAGYASAGAFVAAGLVLLVARAMWTRLEFARLLDVVVPSSLIALAFTRFGCVIERCDPGRPTTSFFGVEYPDAALLHPFGAYLAVGTAAVVLIWIRRVSTPGSRAVYVSLGYACVRFIAEFTREAPSTLHAGHLIALGVAAVAFTWHMVDRELDGG